MSTLYIDRSSSRCGACNKNADPYETAHDMVQMVGEGCGAVYTEVSSHYFGTEGAIRAMRPDLPYVGLPDDLASTP